MRTKLELWQVVKDNFDYHFFSGLCILIFELESYYVINSKERHLLEEDLLEHGKTFNFFLGKEGDPKPRLEFIEKMIKKHSEN